jgi:hypothetical protein
MSGKRDVEPELGGPQYGGVMLPGRSLLIDLALLPPADCTPVHADGVALGEPAAVVRDYPGRVRDRTGLPIVPGPDGALGIHPGDGDHACAAWCRAIARSTVSIMPRRMMEAMALFTLAVALRPPLRKAPR